MLINCVKLDHALYSINYDTCIHVQYMTSYMYIYMHGKGNEGERERVASFPGSPPPLYFIRAVLFKCEIIVQREGRGRAWERG